MILTLALVSTTTLSICFLKVTYYWNHYLGMVICVAGVVITVITDIKDAEGNISLGNGLGDFFAIIGALSYGTGATVTDYILRNKGNNFSVTAYLGFFGAIFTFILFFCFSEFEVFAKFSSYKDSNSLNVLWYPCSALAGFGLYTMAIIIIKISTATVFHLIILCATIYGLIYDTLIFHRPFVSDVTHLEIPLCFGISRYYCWNALLLLERFKRP